MKLNSKYVMPAEYTVILSNCANGFIHSEQSDRLIGEIEISRADDDIGNA